MLGSRSPLTAAGTAADWSHKDCTAFPFHLRLRRTVDKRPIGGQSDCVKLRTGRRLTRLSHPLNEDCIDGPL